MNAGHLAFAAAVIAACILGAAIAYAEGETMPDTGSGTFDTKDHATLASSLMKDVEACKAKLAAAQQAIGEKNNALAILGVQAIQQSGK